MVKIKDKEDREKFYLVFLQKKLAWEYLMIGKSFSISSFSNWTKVFYDQRSTGPLLDRIVHHTHIIQI